MKKKYKKVNLYDVDWLLSNGHCYRTTINVTMEQIKEMKITAKALGETIRYSKSGTKLEEYYV